MGVQSEHHCTEYYGIVESERQHHYNMKFKYNSKKFVMCQK